jgi:hypothetical protein
MPDERDSGRVALDATRSAEVFAREGCVVLRSLVANPKLALLHRYALMRAVRGTMNLQDAEFLGTPSAYSDPFMDGLLIELLPLIERVSGVRLFPTYSYVRIYKRGDVLAKHSDRPACEISVTLSLGYEADRPWPLWIEAVGGSASVSLAPGDALLYRGIELFHWRDAFDGHHSAQVFLHYVNQNGPNAEWRFDKRSSLAPSLPARTRSADE